MTAHPSAAGLTRNLSRPHGFEPASVEGRLPRGLNGTLFRNGPGLFERFGVRYDHLFEGDGAITALRLSEGQAQSAARITQTAGFVAEEAAGHHIGSLAAPWLRRLRAVHSGREKNTANTSTLCWQGRLFALMEAGKPVELDPRDLTTLGETNLGVVGGSFSAHPHRVASRMASFNFGLRYGKQTQLDLFVLPDGGSARLLGSVPLQRPVMLHDFIATDSHLLFFVSPLEIVVWRMMLALRPFHHAFAWHEDHGTEVIAVPIDEPSRVTRFEVPAFYQWHFGNAFEQHGALVVDFVHEKDASSFTQMADFEEVSFLDDRIETRGRLVRAHVDLQGETLELESLGDLPCEFPSVASEHSGRQARDLWVQVERFFDGLLRFGVARVTQGEWTTRWLDAGLHCSEPVLVPHDEGQSLLVLVFDGNTQLSLWLVLDAQTLETQARIPLDHAVPVTFHGSWMPAGR